MILLRMEDDPAEPLQDWSLWLQAMHLADLRPAGALRFSSYDQLVQAAVAGQGIALGRMPLVASLMRSKRLVAPFAATVASPRGYVLIASAAAAARPEVTAFADWIKRAARAPGSSGRSGRAPA